eukprot:CAMPEP_0118946358 /NCGR_PEP_ID=MMETSP1169-20130426/44082_1 /TAXON_ID=36882 /ORGANISM="Pyramimonas obovata, Strain CCMP722" /LENGTH=58 /DNA_ID=CAMNT_0006892309 /DNA_START=9 /DNA_END=182 /DNA_ORIENTATION=+
MATVAVAGLDEVDAGRAWGAALAVAHVHEEEEPEEGGEHDAEDLRPGQLDRLRLARPT